MASDTRERILEVAGRLFEAEGFEGTAVSTILREAGVNSGSLYHFFPSKEALLVSVLRHRLAGLESMLRDAARASPAPLGRVHALLELYRGRLLVSGFSRGCPVGDLALEVSGKYPEARAVIGDYFGRWRDGVGAWLMEALADGGRGSRIEVEDLAAQVLATMQGGVMMARSEASIEPFDGAVDHLRRYLEWLTAPVSETRVSARAAALSKRRPSSDAPRHIRREAVRVGAAEPSAASSAGPESTPVPEDSPDWWKAW